MCSWKEKSFPILTHFFFVFSLTRSLAHLYTFLGFRLHRTHSFFLSPNLRCFFPVLISSPSSSSPIPSISIHRSCMHILHRHTYTEREPSGCPMLLFRRFFFWFLLLLCLIIRELCICVVFSMLSTKGNLFSLSLCCRSRAHTTRRKYIHLQFFVLSVVWQSGYTTAPTTTWWIKKRQQTNRKASENERPTVPTADDDDEKRVRLISAATTSHIGKLGSTSLAFETIFIALTCCHTTLTYAKCKLLIAGTSHITSGHSYANGPQ